jgi:ATP-dependent helicase/nuclease subunit A
MRDMYPYAHVLSELTILTMRNFQNTKQENACMDFTDMEQYAWEILNRNDQEVAKLYRARLKEVMVDEFQDTSWLQNEIIRTVAAPGTIFRVGDVKQSIYRFRGAKPALMRGLADDPAMYRITLDHNYRSSSKIIEFSNLLFQRLMNIEGGEDVYGTEDIVSPGVPSQTPPDDPPIRMILLEEPEQPSDEETENDEESFSAKERKA